jgi:hypothetical protein
MNDPCGDPYRFTIDGGPEQEVRCTDPKGHDDWHVYELDGIILVMWNGSQTGNYRDWSGPRAKEVISYYNER